MMGIKTRDKAEQQLSRASVSYISRLRKQHAVFQQSILAKRERLTMQSIQKLMNSLVWKPDATRRPTQNPSLFELLPYDIHCVLFDHLSSPLSCYNMEDAYPKTREQLFEMWAIPWDRGVLKQHPFYQLAASCRTMRTAVERYCKHLLVRQKELLGSNVPSYPISHLEWSSQVIERMRNFTKLSNGAHLSKGFVDIPTDPPYRSMWVNFAHCRCMFCGKPSKRRATWQYMNWACKKCEKRNWPYTTYDTVVRKTILRPLHIKDPQVVFPDSNLLPLPCAYNYDNGFLLLQKDVSERIDYVRGQDPLGALANAIQKKIDSTLVIYAPDGTKIELDTNPQVEGRSSSRRWRLTNQGSYRT